MHPFGDAGFHERCRDSPACQSRGENIHHGDAARGRHAHHEQPASTHLPHHKVVRDFHPSQSLRFGHPEARSLPRDQSPVRYVRQSKTLHRQDSGIDMGSPGMEKLEIEIDIDMESTSDMAMDDFPAPGCFPHGSPHPKFLNLRRSSQPPRSPRKETVSHVEPFDCYYVIPPCPAPPPVVHNSAVQELARIRHRVDSPPSRHSYNSPSMPPRAPSPPVSPAPTRGHQQTRRGNFVPIVDHSRYERRYHSTGKW